MKKNVLFILICMLLAFFLSFTTVYRFYPDGIFITIKNRFEDIDQPIEIRFTNTEREQTLYSHDRIETGRLYIQAEKEIPGEGRIYILMGGKPVYSGGYLDAGLNKLMLDIEVIDYYSDADRVSMNVRFTAGSSVLHDRIDVFPGQRGLQ